MAKKTTNFDNDEYVPEQANKLQETPNPTSRSSGASKSGKRRAAAEAAELKTSPQYGHGGALNSQETETQWLDAQYPDVSHADGFEHVHDPSDRDSTKDSHPAERCMKDDLDFEKRDELQRLRGDLLGCRCQLHEAELRLRAAHHEILELKEERMRLNEELMLLKARSLPVSGATKTMVKSELMEDKDILTGGDLEYEGTPLNQVKTEAFDDRFSDSESIDHTPASSPIWEGYCPEEGGFSQDPNSVDGLGPANMSYRRVNVRVAKVPEDKVEEHLKVEEGKVEEATQSSERGWDGEVEWDIVNDVPLMVGRDTEKRLYDTIVRGAPFTKRVRFS